MGVCARDRHERVGFRQGAISVTEGAPVAYLAGNKQLAQQVDRGSRHRKCSPARRPIKRATTLATPTSNLSASTKLRKDPVMPTERFLNTYHNASTAPSPDVPADLASFMLAADPVLAEAAELARILARAHQGAAAQLIGEGWAHACKYFSLSEKYAAWADYRAPAKGVGIHAYAHEVSRPIRLTDEELRAHPEWRNFGDQIDRHPPMWGWLAVP
jgi:hypothetical protein